MLSIKKLSKSSTPLWWVLFSALLIYWGWHTFQHRDVLTRPFDAKEMSRIYSESPYVVGSGAKTGIGDDGLYAFAGYYYFLQGGDVSSVNFEHPPLGKYLLGLSIFFTGNELVIQNVYLGLLIWFLYWIGRTFLLSPVLSLVAVWLISLDPLIVDQVYRSQIDLPFMVFITGSIYFFVPQGKIRPRYGWSHTCSGLAFSTKFYPFFLIFWSVALIYVYFNDRKGLMRFLLTSLFVPALYLIFHLSFFYYHPSMIEFLRHKKWMVAWFSGSPKIPWNIWRNVFTGQYIGPTGWGLDTNKEWWIGLPFIVLAGVGGMVRILYARTIKGAVFVCAILVLYLVYASFLTTGVIKFLFPIFPVLCVLSVLLVRDLVCSILQRRYGN